MKAGDLVMVDSDCGIKGTAVFVERLLYGFCRILFDGSIVMMDRCFMEKVDEVH